ncbi:MAG: 2TM domain-containing protein [Bacteroidia bacterium]|nr:2TM domain-containing protein [Bacteroidia bacterium]
MDSRTKRFIEASERVKALRNFYLHLIIFIAGSLLIASLLFQVDPGAYAVVWTWLILSTIISWFIGLCIHAWCVFGNRVLFSKKWEDRKIQEYLENDITEFKG